MKKLLAVLSLLAFAAGFGALAPAARAQDSPVHYVAGIYNSQVYNSFKSTAFGGPYASGSATILVCPGIVTLPDGYAFAPFSTSNPIIVGQGTANQETVTPSAVSLSAAPPGAPATQPCANITATYSNSHGQGDIIRSGSQGVDEALLDAGNHGGGLVYWFVTTGDVALSTGATTTTLCSSCIPQGAIVIGAVARVTTTITTACTGWELGDGTTAGRFTANNTGLTAGTTSNLDIQNTSGVASTTTGMLNITTTKSLIATCAGGDPGAGALHASLFGWLLAVPTN